LYPIFKPSKAMIFKSFPPSPELYGLVKTYHLRHFEFPTYAKIPYKAFPPRDEQYLVFYVRGFEQIFLQRDRQTEIRKKTMLIGQSTQMIHRMVSHQFLLIQVPFFPGALYRLTKIPFYELRDKSLDLDLIFPKETREVDQRLAETQEYDKMIEIVDRFLIELFLKNIQKEIHTFDRALPLFSSVGETANIDLLANQACLSIRQLERLSKKYFGVGPKTMVRINRFTWSFIHKSRNPELTWFDVAIACGYEDYQHMAKDYRDFAGVTPTQLWAEDRNAPDRVLGLR
jgi:AraC-like DNA-binding protein